MNNIGGYRSIRYITVLCWEVLGPEVNLKKNFHFLLYLLYLSLVKLHILPKKQQQQQKKLKKKNHLHNFCKDDMI